MKKQLNSILGWTGQALAFLILFTTSLGHLQAQPVAVNATTNYSNPTSQNFGIGTVTALAKLHVADGALLATGTTGSTPTSGAGTRMMWVPDRAAFRAGAVTGTQWDAANIGPYSVALGLDTKAAGIYTICLGNNSNATGNSSVAIGNGANATGNSAVVLGTWSLASGNTSIAIGNLVQATAVNSVAMGFAAYGLKQSSIAIGSYATADGQNAVAEGTWVSSTANGAMTFGAGYDATNVLTNNVTNGIMFGTRSNLPTMFIAPATGINTTGGVGIGTTYVPGGYKLSVNGKIIAEEVRVELRANWPDYVFEKDYDLQSLPELETYIAQHGHLPNIPAAAEVAKEGIALGEMNAKLLQKIEELTLHLIAQDKRLKALEIENAELLDR
jgi:hypothetical protein